MPSPTPSAASIAPASRCTSPPWCATAPARPSGLPITVIFSRPDGVEHSRITLTDQGLGGRSITLALAGSAMTGTWRAKMHTDPEGRRHRPGLVPGRGLRARAPRPQARAGRAGAVAAGARHHQARSAAISMARPPPASPSRARSPSSRRARTICRASPATSSASPTSRSRRCASRSKGCPPPTRTARPTLPCSCPPCRKTSRPLEADVILRLRESGGRTIERTVTLPVDLKSAAHRHQAAVQGRTGSRRASRRASRPSCSAPTARPSTPRASSGSCMRLEHRWQWYSRDG